MKKLILFLLYASQVFASPSCFIAKENGKILKTYGDCTNPYAPQSTFKIVLSLIGFDSSILKNETNPSWDLPKCADSYVNVCKKSHNPSTWMRDSCLWYSQILTTKLGMEKFKYYISKFSYGNMDLSGGLTNAWVSSSLKISPHEQVDFMQKICDRVLPISEESYNKTKKIMFIQTMAGGWKLYGKTGNGEIDKKGHLQHGWFVGYIEKGNRYITFASHIVDKEKQSVFASFRARNETLNNLWYIIDEIEK